MADHGLYRTSQLEPQITKLNKPKYDDSNHSYVTLDLDFSRALAFLYLCSFVCYFGRIHKPARDINEKPQSPQLQVAPFVNGGSVSRRTERPTLEANMQRAKLACFSRLSWLTGTITVW